MGNDRCVPSAFQRGEAERLLPVAPALSEGPERAQGPRQPRPGLDPHVCTGRTRRPVRSLHVPPQQLGRPAEVAEGIVYLPQVIGGLPLQGAVAERGREFEGLLARRDGAVGVSRQPECRGHLASTRPSRARSSSARARASASPNRVSCRPYSPRMRSGRATARRISRASIRVSPDSGRCARAWRAWSK